MRQFIRVAPVQKLGYFREGECKRERICMSEAPEPKQIAQSMAGSTVVHSFNLSNPSRRCIWSCNSVIDTGAEFNSP